MRYRRMPRRSATCGRSTCASSFRFRGRRGRHKVKLTDQAERAISRRAATNFNQVYVASRGTVSHALPATSSEGLGTRLCRSTAISASNLASASMRRRSPSSRGPWPSTPTSRIGGSARWLVKVVFRLFTTRSRRRTCSDRPIFCRNGVSNQPPGEGTTTSCFD
jgi:hypothetical protein